MVNTCIVCFPEPPCSAFAAACPQSSSLFCRTATASIHRCHSPDRRRFMECRCACLLHPGSCLSDIGCTSLKQRYTPPPHFVEALSPFWLRESRAGRTLRTCNNHSLNTPHTPPVVVVVLDVQVSLLQAGAALPDLRLGLVSNALGVPLFHLDVRQLQAALRHEAGRYLDATVSAMVGAGYFNQASRRFFLYFVAGFSVSTSAERSQERAAATTMVLSCS